MVKRTPKFALVVKHTLRYKLSPKSRKTPGKERIVRVPHIRQSTLNKCGKDVVYIPLIRKNVGMLNQVRNVKTARPVGKTV